jgi:hypothetical protein
MLYLGVLNHRYVRFPSYVDNDMYSKEGAKNLVFRKVPKKVNFPRKMFSEKRGRVLEKK